MDAFSGWLLQESSKFPSPPGVSTTDSTFKFLTPVRSTSPSQISTNIFTSRSSLPSDPIEERRQLSPKFKQRKYEKISEELLRMGYEKEKEAKKSSPSISELNKKFDVATLSQEKSEFLAKAYFTALTSPNPVYAFVVDYFMGPLNDKDKNFLNRKNQLSPEHFMGISNEGPSLIPVILFGILHSLKVDLNEDNQQKRIRYFLTNLFGYSLKTGLPIFQTWHEIGVIDLLGSIPNTAECIDLFKQFYLKGQKAAKLLEDGISKDAELINSTTINPLDLRQNLWKLCLTEDHEILKNLYNLCEQIKVSAKKSSILFSELALDFPLLKYFVIFKSRSSSKIRHLELLVNLEESLATQTAILGNRNGELSEHIFYLQTKKHNNPESYLRSVLATREVSPYVLKVLRGWSHNLLFIEQTCVSLLPKLSEVAREHFRCYLFDSNKVDLTVVEQGTRTYKNHLHLVFIYIQALLSCTKEQEKIFLKKIEDQITFFPHLLHGAVFGVTAKSFFKYLQAKHGDFSKLASLFANLEDHPDQKDFSPKNSEENNPYLKEINALIESAKAKKISNKKLLSSSLEVSPELEPEIMPEIPFEAPKTPLLQRSIAPAMPATRPPEPPAIQPAMVSRIPSIPRSIAPTTLATIPPLQKMVYTTSKIHSTAKVEAPHNTTHVVPPPVIFIPRESKFDESWDQFYQQTAEVVLRLFKFESFSYTLQLALKGNFKTPTPLLKVQIERSLDVILENYQTYRKLSEEKAKEALFDFFANELPSQSVRLFVASEASLDPIRNEFNAIILKASQASSAENAPTNDIIIKAFIHQLAKTIEWKKEHIALCRKGEQEKGGSKEILVLISIKNSNDSLTVVPAVFDFSNTFSLKGFRQDQLQTAEGFLRSIFSDPLQRSEDGKFDLTKKQFQEFYKYLEKTGPYYSSEDTKKEFLLISQGKVINHQKIEAEKPLIINDKGQAQKSESISTQKETKSPNTSLVWSLPSLKSQRTFAEAQNPLDDYLRLDGLKVLDGLWRKMNRQRIFQKSKKVTHLPTDLSVFLSQSSVKHASEISFCFSGLKPYQQDAVRLLVKLKAMGLHGGLLGLDTGLGKTPTMIEFCAQLFKNESAPVFYTGTKSTILQSEDSFRVFMGKMILEELNKYFIQFMREYVDKNLTLEKIQRYYVIFSAFKISLENAKKNIPTKRGNEEILEQRQNQRKLIEGFLQEWDEAFKEFEACAEKQARISTFCYEDLLKSHQGNLPQGLWNFDIFKDIIGAMSWEKMDVEITGQKKIVVATLELLAKHHERVISSSPQCFLVDEAHVIDNPDTVAFRNLELIASNLQQKQHPAFMVFASATLFEHRISNLLAYLKLITPQFDLAQLKQEVIPIADLALIIPKRLNDLAKYLSKLSMSKKKLEETVLIKLYKEVKNLFWQMEVFKETLSEVSVRAKKTDPAIREQWNFRIPITEHVTHSLIPSERQKTRLTEIDQKYTTDSDTGKFLAYHKSIYKTLFYPNILETQNNTERGSIIDQLSKMSVEEIIEWAKPSPMLTYFLTNPEFLSQSKTGVLIYVNETMNGKILQVCLSKIYGVKVPYLTGETSNLRRRTMAQNFEKPLDGKPLFFLSNSKAGSAGVDLKVNGFHVYFTFWDFNPKEKEQSENRISRVDSDKQVVYVHTFRFGIPLEKILDWHTEKKNSSEIYYFDRLLPDQSNLYKLFENMNRLMHFEISVSNYSEKLAISMKNLQNWMLEFASEDKTFGARPTGDAKRGELKRKQTCLAHEKGKEKIDESEKYPSHKRAKLGLEESSSAEASAEMHFEKTQEKTYLAHEKGKEKIDDSKKHPSHKRAKLGLVESASSEAGAEMHFEKTQEKTYLAREKGKEKIDDSKKHRAPKQGKLGLEESSPSEAGVEMRFEKTSEQGKATRGVKRVLPIDEIPVLEIGDNPKEKEQTSLKKQRVEPDHRESTQFSQSFQGGDVKYEIMSKFLTSFQSFNNLDIPHSQFTFQKNNYTTLEFSVLPMRQRDPGRKDNFARTVFAGYKLGLLEAVDQQRLVQEFKQAEVKDSKLYLTARVSSTFLKLEHPELGQHLWDDLQFQFIGSDQERDWNGFIKNLLIEIYTPNGNIQIYNPESNEGIAANVDQPKQIIRLLRLGMHFDLLYLNNETSIESV